VSYRVIVDLISATTTETGLTVRCELDPAFIRRASPCQTMKWPPSTSFAMNFTESGTIRSIQAIIQIERLIPDGPLT
jgi:hypothetical protein